MEKAKLMTTKECTEFFRDFEENKSKGLSLYKQKVGSTIAGLASIKEVEQEALDLRNYRYFFDIEKNNKKSSPICITMWLDNYGKVVLDRKTYSLLKTDMKLSFIAEKYKATYYDHFTTETEVADMSTLEDFEKDDVNSLIFIYKFISKIASGIRSPSDKDSASEMKYYLQSLLNRNSISI